jgi:gamma-glutamylcyclotransferase (GGCT)/AIG2-like uncharacterized protein YtfP
MQLRVFVYGTLKQGQRNHAHYCRGVLAIEPASVLGQLYYLSHGQHLPYGYPMLQVPPEHILAIGTGDYLEDAALPSKLASQGLPPAPNISGDWEPIFGEIHTFDDPLRRLPAWDALEDFHPGGESLYHRVVLRVLPPQSTLVWTYVAANGRLPAAAARIGPCWP